MPTVTDVRERKPDELTKVAQPARALEIPKAPPSPLPTRPIFADSLIDYDRPDKRRRRRATVFSFVLQCCLVGVLLLVPLMFTDVLPKQQLLTFLVAPPPPPPPPPPAAEAAARVVRQVQSDLLSSGELRTPTRIPQKVQMVKEEEAPPPLPTGGVVGGVPGGIPGGQLGGVIGGIIGQTSKLSIIPRLAAPAMPKRIRVSQGVTQGMLISKVEPVYPMLAMQARIQGQVLLHAIISRTGEITELSLISGHPMLAPAAIDAVRRWRYRPFLLNGEPIEVETSVTVNFQLQ